MCKKHNKEQLFELFEQVFCRQSNEVALARLKQQLCRFPQEVYSILLLDFFCVQQKTSAYYLEKNLFPLAGELYMGVIIFLGQLEMVNFPIVNSGKENKEESGLVKLLPYLRRFCRAMLLIALKSPQISFSGQKRIQQALTAMLKYDGRMNQLRLEGQVPFESGEIFSRLQYYLTDADVLADLPQFLFLYFTWEELQPISHDLNQWKLNKFSKIYIERLLDQRNKKNQIRQELRKIIYDCPIAIQAKQAYAVYITLGAQGYDWVSHPFIRRFIANSYLEGQVAFKEAEQKVIKPV